VGRIKLDVRKTRHRQRVGDFAVAANDALIIFDAEQYMGRLASVGDFNVLGGTGATRPSLDARVFAR
jgi:hypothetical protein